MSTSSLMWAMLFGAIGAGFFVYGRKQRASIPFVCGIALMTFPIFVSNVVLVVVLGAVLTVAPFIVKL